MTQSLTDLVAAEVRAEMARQGVKQRELAAALGISQVQVSARLRGRIAFNTTELEAVAARLDVPATKFMPASAPAA